MATVGYHPIYIVMQNKIKHEMILAKENISASDVIKISFLKNADGKIADNNFKSIGDDEFIFKHYYFDVLKKINTKNEVTYYCLCDEKETNLVLEDIQQTQTHSVFQPNQKSNSKKTEKENHTFNLFFFRKNICLIPLSNHAIRFLYKNDKIQSYKTFTVSPPPKVEVI
jgi:hypothetical protein